MKAIHTKQRRGASKVLLSCASALALLSPFAFAQDASSDTSEDETVTLDKVTVTGIRGAAESQRNAKRNATGITDSIFASDFLDTPDQNVAEALQRVTGIGIDRVDGEGSQVTIRGVDPNLNQVTLNGQVLTNGGDGNSVDFSTLSASLVNAIEVVKSPSANQDEGSLGGTVNLTTRRPLDANGRVISGELRFQRSDLADENDVAINVGYVNQFLDDRFGVAASLSIDDQSTRSDIYDTFNRFRARNWPGTSFETGADIGNVNATHPEFAGYFLQLSERERVGGTLSLQYQPNSKTDMWLDLAYSDLSRSFINHQKRLNRFNRNSATNQNPGRPFAGQIIIDETTGDVVSALSDNTVGLHLSRLQETTTETTTLNLGTTSQFADSWEAEINFGFSSSEQTFPVNRRLNFLGASFAGSRDGGFSLVDTNGNFLDVPTVIFGPGNEPDDPDYALLQLFENDRDVTDDRYSVGLDFTREFESDFIKNVQFGFKFFDRERDRSETQGRFSPELPTGVTSIRLSDPGVGVPFPVDDFFSGVADNVGEVLPDGWVVPDFDFVFDTYAPADTTTPTDRLNTYRIEQDALAGYLLANYEALGGRLSGDFGVRIVETNTTSTGSTGINFPAGFGSTVIDAEVSHSYTNTLPSLNIKYALTDDVLLRFAAAKVMARPEFDDLRPGLVITATNPNATPTARGGNPALDPTEANQYDLSLEYYFGDSGLLAATLFYKDITSFIFDQTSFQSGFSDPLNSSSGILLDSSTCTGTDIFDASTCDVADVVVRSPLNGEGGEIQGIELSYQQNYDFLPGVFQHLGAIVNYTYTDSEATFFSSSDNLGGNDAYSGFPFPNTSQDTFNATGYWENDAWSFRTAYNYRSERLVEPAAANYAIWADPRESLDMSLSYTVRPGTVIKLEGVNLTNESERLFATRALTDLGLPGEGSAFDGAPDFRTARFENTGRIFRIGLRSRF